MVCKPFGFEQKGELINNKKPQISQMAQIINRGISVALLHPTLIILAIVYLHSRFANF